MIFATVGTTELSFNRFIEALDLFAKESNEEVIIQIGYSTYEPQFMEWFRFDAGPKIKQLVQDAEIVVSHGGFGILCECIRLQKRVVAVPRRADLGEAVNPQHELVNYFAELGYITALDNPNNIEDALTLARQHQSRPWTFESTIPALVSDYIQAAIMHV